MKLKLTKRQKIVIYEALNKRNLLQQQLTEANSQYGSLALMAIEGAGYEDVDKFDLKDDELVFDVPEKDASEEKPKESAAFKHKKNGVKV